MDIAVTVVVPTYNTAQGVLRGIDSLRRQTMPRERFEVVYVDDGSTDGTGELLDAEFTDEPNFSVVHIDNSGWPGRPRNVGVEHARGRFVFFMDDDDRLGPEALERLHRKAVQDEADIVVGRMAGVGRGAPREVFQKPMSRESLRTRPVLLSTLTVQKLFRRRFLLDNGLSFPEGKVRLEDHIFMLRAYLATERVSVVHDYTCYYWVRNSGFGNISFAPKEPAEFLSSIERIFDIIDEQVEPGAFRDRLIAQWLRSKLLGLFQGRKFLLQDDERIAGMHRIAGDLVRKRVTDGALARLNAFARLRAAVLTADDPGLLRTLAEFEEDVFHRTRVTGFRWQGAELAVETETTLERRSSGAPLEFAREGDAVYWDLPEALLSVPAIRDAAEISRELPKTVHRAYGTRSGDPAVVRLPLESRVREEPAGAPGRVRLLLRATLRVDAATGDQGGPLTGTWRFSTRVAVGGLGDIRTLGPDRAPEAEHSRVPAFVGSGSSARFVNPYWNADGALVLSDTGSWRPLRRALRTGLAAAVSRTASGLRVEIPLAAQPAESGALTLTGTAEGREPVSALGGVHAPQHPQEPPDLPLSVLSATLPEPAGRGVLHLGVGEGDAYTPLELDLYWTPFGRRIGRPESSLPRRCSRVASRGSRNLARRLPGPLRRLLNGAGRGGASPATGQDRAGAGAREDRQEAAAAPSRPDPGPGGSPGSDGAAAPGAGLPASGPDQRALSARAQPQ